MNVTLINDHVLLAIAPDRRQRPDWSRAWKTEVAAAVTEAETRRALRPQPRVRLDYAITPRNLAEQIELSECVMAARKSGLACSPYHGRSSRLLSEAAESDSVTVDNAFAWAVGDWIFLRHRSGAVEVRQLTAVNLVDQEWTLEFADVLEQTYVVGAMVWPILFGEFACDEMTGLSPQTGPLRVSITELESPRATQLGEEEAPSGDGIGTWAVEDDNIVQ
jgi:hypothetical protein